MLTFIYASVLAAVFQVVISQGPPPLIPNLPPHCRGPPPGVEKPNECCKIPPFFTDEDFAECGFQKLNDTTPPPRPGPPGCSKQLCMLKKYDLLKDEAIDHEAVGKFLDKWTEKNTAFQTPIATAKERCVGKNLPGPPHICEANKIVFCITSTLFSECPVWGETDGCKKLKDHMEECRQYFPK